MRTGIGVAMVIITLAVLCLTPGPEAKGTKVEFLLGMVVIALSVQLIMGDKH